MLSDRLQVVSYTRSENFDSQLSGVLQRPSLLPLPLQLLPLPPPLLLLLPPQRNFRHPCRRLERRD
jgi:hypothetical protein